MLMDTCFPFWMIKFSKIDGGGGYTAEYGKKQLNYSL